MCVAVRGLILFLVCLTLGCEGAIEFPGDPFRPELVVTSEFSAHSSWHAIVQRTVGFDEVVSLPAVVEHATITVAGNDGSLVELKHKGGGFYQSNCCRPETGITYQLVVEADGFAQATAIDALPAPLGIDAVRRTSVTREGQPVARLEVDINDDGGVRNYYELSIVFDPRWYHVRFTVLNAEVKDQLRDYGAGDFIEPDLSIIYVHRALLHDEAFDGRALTLILETDPSVPVEQIGGPLSVKMRTVSEAYYQYWRTQLLQENSSMDPFAEPVTIRSNVTGGHGVFAGYAPETYGELTDAVMHERISGSYVISDFVVSQNGRGQDYIALGGSGELNVLNDNTVLGGLQIPIDEGEPRSASLDGGFVLRGTTIRLFHSAKTVIRDMKFEFRPDTGSLEGFLTIDRNQGVHVRFERKDAG